MLDDEPYFAQIGVVCLRPLGPVSGGYASDDLSIFDEVRKGPLLSDNLDNKDLISGLRREMRSLHTSRHIHANEYTSPANVHRPPFRTSGGIHRAAPPCQVLIPIVLLPASASLASPKSAKCTELFSSSRIFA